MVVVTTGTGGAHKIYLISGKQSAGSGAADGRFSRSVSVVLPPPGNQASSDTDSQGSGPPQRKRQRLTHLSPEEKSLRRLVLSPPLLYLFFFIKYNNYWEQAVYSEYCYLF